MIKNIEELTLQSIDNNVVVIKNRVNVESIQKYINQHDETININYQFPIPANAAVYCFELKIDDEIYTAKIEEERKAVEMYQDASQKGDSAAMLLKHDNAFTFMISNIKAGKEFQITIKYVYSINASNNKYRLSIPTTLAPKYGGERLTYLVSDTEIAKHKTNFNIKIYEGHNIKADSDHDIEIVNHEQYLEVTAINVIPNRDFTLSYEVKNNSYIIETENENEKYEYLSVAIPESEDNEREQNLKYMFIMDRSGSMYGQKFEKAKNMLKLCLRNLDETDQFNIIFFDTNILKYKEEYSYANDNEIEKADKFIDETQATGCTNIYAALKECILENNLKILLFTDGQVYNCEEIYELIQHKGTDTKLFCFGIDDAIDEEFINKMAKLGDGRSEFLNSSEDIYEKTIHQMVSTFYKPIKLHIDTTDEELLRTVYPEDSFSLIKNSHIKSINGLDVDINRIKDNELFEILKIYYYYDLCSNKKLDKELIIKYSKQSNILTNYTTFILIKNNEEKEKATKNIEISGMIPTGWEYMPMEQEFNPNFMINSFACSNSVSNMKGKGLFEKKQMIVQRCSEEGLGIYRDSISCNLSYNTTGSYNSPNPPKSKGILKKLFGNKKEENKQEIEHISYSKTSSSSHSKEDELLELFLKQKADGSIDNDIDQTIRAVELYKELGEPKTYKIQYKKAIKFLKSKNINF